MIMAQLNYNSKQLAAIFSCCENTITNYLNKLEKPDNDCSVLVDLPKHTYSISGQFIDKGIFRLGYHNAEIMKFYNDYFTFLVLPFALNEVKILDLYPIEKPYEKAQVI